LKVSDENSRIRIPDPDPLVRGLDPGIRIRIHPKISWICNTPLLTVGRPCIFALNGAKDRGRITINNVLIRYHGFVEKDPSRLMTVFFSNTALFIMKNSSHMYIDGTFKVSSC
jgi:hypothetical protein